MLLTKQNVVDIVGLVLIWMLLAANLGLRYAADPADLYKCNALRDQGHWLRTLEHPAFVPKGPDGPPSQVPHGWSPLGCMLRNYNGTSAVAFCLGEAGKLIFIGDAYIQQIFWATVSKLFGEVASIDQLASKDISRDAHGLRLEFIWDPWLNSSALYRELQLLQAYHDARLEATAAVNAGSPSAMLIGGGHWYARHFDSDASNRYRESIDGIVSAAIDGHLHRVPEESPHQHSTPSIHSNVFFAPVLEPHYKSLAPSRAATITPLKIKLMNDYLRRLSRQSSPRINVLWSYDAMTHGHPDAYGMSGLHVVQPVAHSMADVLLNLRCNGKLAVLGGWPLDRRCCSVHRSLAWHQFVLVAIMGLLFLFLMLRSKGGWRVVAHAWARKRD